jgi:rRNA maturation endonuclease Nob1
LKNTILRLKADQEYSQLASVLLVFVAVALILVFFLLSSRQRQKLLESEALAMKNEARNKELLLNRLDASKEIMTLEQHPNTDLNKTQSKLHSVVNKLTFNAADREALINTVNELFDGFADKLSARYPTLTPEDIQLCCMIRCDFDAGNVATIMGINFESVYKKRSRLRKKLGLKKKDNVDDFLAKI